MTEQLLYKNLPSGRPIMEHDHGCRYVRRMIEGRLAGRLGHYQSEVPDADS
jgi:hypothetical protein